MFRKSKRKNGVLEIAFKMWKKQQSRKEPEKSFQQGRSRREHGINKNIAKHFTKEGMISILNIAEKLPEVLTEMYPLDLTS